MATRAVFTTADEHHDDDQQDQDDRDDPRHLHLAWCSGAVGPHAGVVTGVAVGVGVLGQVSHLRFLLYRAS